MDCKIDWLEHLDSEAVGLRIDKKTYGHHGAYSMYIDQELYDPPRTYACCKVEFKNDVPIDEARRVMQTVLMLAKARYNL